MIPLFFECAEDDLTKACGIPFYLLSSRGLNPCEVPLQYTSIFASSRHEIVNANPFQKSMFQRHSKSADAQAELAASEALARIVLLQLRSILCGVHVQIQRSCILYHH